MKIIIWIRLIDEMEQRRKQFPFTEEETLQDPMKVKARQDELRESIDNYKKSILALGAQLTLMLAPYKQE